MSKEILVLSAFAVCFSALLHQPLRDRVMLAAETITNGFQAQDDHPGAKWITVDNSIGNP